MASCPLRSTAVHCHSLRDASQVPVQVHGVGSADGGSFRRVLVTPRSVVLGGKRRARGLVRCFIDATVQF